MPDPIDRLRGLAALLPDDGPDPSVLRSRGRRRVRRRRLAVASALALALVAGAAWALPRADRERELVRTDPGPATTTSLPPTTTRPPAPTTTTTPGDAGDQGLRVVPHRDLPDQVGAVALTLLDPLTDPATVAWIGQCAAEALDLAVLDGAADDEVRSWCGGLVDDPVGPFGLALDRRLDTPVGVVDCAASVGRCLAVARVGPGDLRWATLGFAGDDAEPGLVLAIDPLEPVFEGGPVTVTGTGGVPGTPYLLQQCATAPPDPGVGAGVGAEAGACDLVRTKEVDVGDDGTFTTDFLVSTQVVLPLAAGDPGPSSVGCTGCVLRATSRLDDGDTAEVALLVQASRTPTVAWIGVADPGPVAPGSTITLQGHGFQSGGRVPDLGWCSSVVEAGVPDDCAHPEVAAPTIGPTGEFTLAFPTPPADFTTPGGVRCADAPGACMVAEVPAASAAPLYRVALDLTG